MRAIVDKIRPDTLITFGPDGYTGHPDHRAVSRWATDAWARTCPRAELWYPTFTPDFHRTWGPLNDQIGLWAEQPEPPSSDPAALVRSARLTDELADLKLAALEAHRSQTAPLVELVGRATYREWWRTESFRRADVVALVARPAHRRGQEGSRWVA